MYKRKAEPSCHVTFTNTVFNINDISNETRSWISAILQDQLTWNHANNVVTFKARILLF